MRRIRVVPAIASLLVACGHGAGPPGSSAPRVADKPRVSSNVLRTDYAGSAACKDCHPKEYAAWQASPMHNMTRLIGGATVRAPFDGAALAVHDDTVTMFERDGARFMHLDSPAHKQTFRVTKVIGGRYREDFVGVDVTDEPHPATDSGYGGERILPATFVFSTQSWRYKGYSVMVPERPSMSTRARWAQTCIACHNTMPTLDYLFDDLYGPTLPSYQGKVSDHLLPPSRDWRTTSRDDDALAAAIGDEIAFVGGARPGADAELKATLRAGAAALRQHLGEKQLVEVGIGCEACHGGAAEHAREPHLLPSFEPRSAVLAVTPGRPPAGEARWIDRTCARCHTVLFTRYPWTWEGARRSDAVPGGSTTNSGEGRDFQLGGCATQMSCTHCHDPHAADDRAALARLATVSGNTKCISCHTKYNNVIALEAHSHHKATGDGASCVACHMPKKNMGLDYGLERYHRIGSPTDRLRVERDRPLECALCHTDKSVDELVGAMERWWGKRYDRAALRGLYGDDLGANVMTATLARGKPHEQAAAMATLASIASTASTASTAGGEPADQRRLAGARAAVPLIVPSLAHEYPLVRLFAKRALETITGGPVPVDVGAPAAEVREQAARWLASRSSPAASASPAPDGAHAVNATP